MSDEGDLAALRAEVAELREEVRLLRASQPVTWYQPSSYANACAGGQFPQTVWLNTACADPVGVSWVAEHGPELAVMAGGETVLPAGDDEGEYVCPRCERDQCERCRDEQCACCAGRP